MELSPGITRPRHSRRRVTPPFPPISSDSDVALNAILTLRDIQVDAQPITGEDGGYIVSGYLLDRVNTILRSLNPSELSDED